MSTNNKNMLFCRCNALHHGLSFRLFLALGMTLLLLSSCHNKKPKVFDPSYVDFEAAYNPYLENQFYPSLVMGVASLSDQTFGLNDTNALVSVSVTAPASNAVLRITIDSSNLNYVTIFQEVLPIKDVRYTFHPSVKWKYDKLYQIRQQGITDLTFTCFINDEEVDVKNVRINYRSANDCLLSVLDSDNKLHDFRWLFAAYVNEEHPYIDSILSDILQQGVVTRITGYQKDAKSVVSQVEAIWYYALERGITYSSISCTSTPTKRANVQHIRFFDQVYNNRQANCVDACVFFASIMVDFPALTKNYNETIARDPDAQGTHRISETMNSRYNKYLTADEKKRWEDGRMSFEEYKRVIAHNIFLKSTEQNRENYNNNKKLFADPDNQLYQQLDIEQLRKLVQPING